MNKKHTKIFQIQILPIFILASNLSDVIYFMLRILITKLTLPLTACKCDRKPPDANKTLNFPTPNHTV